MTLPPRFLARVHEDLALRRGLGFSLETPRWLLVDFARYAEQMGHQGALTIDLAVTWVLSSPEGNPAQAARRLAVVRQFARYLAVIDPATEVPPAGLLGRVPRRRLAHIYSQAEIDALLRQAMLLHPRTGLRPRTYLTFFSLLVSTGLRLSEACRLTRDDVGHAKVTDTYWYLSAVPELLALSGQRFEHFARQEQEGAS